MSKVIFKSMYLKSAEGGIKHALNLVDYVARREGVIKSETYQLEGEATSNQSLLIDEINQVLDIEGSSLFKQYGLFPTKENASRLITFGLKQINGGQECVTDPKILLDYIAERPGVLNSKCEEIHHGLFDLNGDVESITKAKREMMISGSNIHHHIISIKLEDAYQVGMDNKDVWEALVRRTAVKLAYESHISFEDLGLVGAVHENKTSFHVHLMQYSKSNDRNMYFTDKSLERLRKTITKDVYQNQILNIAKERDSFFKIQITPDMLKAVDNELIDQLQAQLKNHKGRLIWGYLNPENKFSVAKTLNEVFTNNQELKEKLDKYLEQQIKYQSLFTKVEDENKLKSELYEKFIFPTKNDKTTIHNNLIQSIMKNNQDYQQPIEKQKLCTNEDVLKLERELYNQLESQFEGKTEPIPEVDQYFSSNLYNLETKELKMQCYVQVKNNFVSMSKIKEYEQLGYFENTNYQVNYSDKYLLLFANVLKTETKRQRQITKVKSKRRRKRTKNRKRNYNNQIER